MVCAVFIRYRLYDFLSVAGIILCLLLDFQSALIGISATTKVVRVPYIFAYKGTRTDCGGSADLSAVGDCARCYATTNIG